MDIASEQWNSYRGLEFRCKIYIAIATIFSSITPVSAKIKLIVFIIISKEHDRVVKPNYFCGNLIKPEHGHPVLSSCKEFFALIARTQHQQKTNNR